MNRMEMCRVQWTAGHAPKAAELAEVILRSGAERDCSLQDVQTACELVQAACAEATDASRISMREIQRDAEAALKGFKVDLG